MADAEATAAWLHDRVLPATVNVDDPAQAAASWFVVRARFLELDEQLTSLLRTAPDGERRAAAASLRAALADVTTALDQGSRAGSTDERPTARLRVELALDRLERRLAHEPLVPPARTHDVLVGPDAGPVDGSSAAGEAGRSGGEGRSADE
jgi:hypothetical protein